MRPSFVFILADDLGYADLGCYCGRPAASGAPFATCSPSLDRMAREGLRFTDGYANSSVCSPTRFALATGRWQHRLRGGADEPISGRVRGNPVLGLPPEHPTLASLLRDAGYATALVGKWHLGYPPHFHPLKSGYQEFFGSLSGGFDYFTHRDTAGVHDLWDGEQEIHRATTQQGPLSIIVLDVDHFKEVNDRFGHPAGDRILRGVARAIRSQMRSCDTCVRYAGDEFIITVPGVGREEINGVQTRIAAAIANHKFVVARNKALHVTVSMGADSFPDEGKSIESLIAVADAQMYARKFAGRVQPTGPEAYQRFALRRHQPLN